MPWRIGSWRWSWRNEQRRLNNYASISVDNININNNGDEIQRDRTLLYLNVYDLTHLNNYLYWIGLGIFHSGIEVYGTEYGFGAHDYSFSGVFEVEPRSCPGFIFRKSVLLGTTDMSRSEFRSFMQHLASEYHGDTYHLIAKNCNHFTEDVCMRLTGSSIPGWVNRLARFASFFNCLLPEHIQIAAVRRNSDHLACSDDESESAKSSSTSADTLAGDDPDRLLLAPARADIAFLHEKPGTTLSKENEMFEISSS